MSYANAGNLDTYIASRHSSSPSLSLHPLEHPSDDEPSPEELKRRLRERRKSRSAGGGAGGPAQAGGPRGGDARAVMLLGLEEVASLFGDIVHGLHFLVSSHRCAVWGFELNGASSHGSIRMGSCIWI